MGESDEAAAANARILAAARTMGEYPPVLWGDDIHFLRGGALVPDFARHVEERIDILEQTGRLDFSADYVTDNFVPRWNDRVGGWTLVSKANAEVPLRMNDGSLVTIRTGAAVRDALQRHIDGIVSSIDDIEAERIARDQLQRIQREASVGPLWLGTPVWNAMP